MAKNNFLLLSLDDEKTKNIANVVSNKSCKKILDYLAENDDVTESQVAKDLNLAISTVHYNLKQLIESGLVLSEEFHYSKKGREVSHYKLANKVIIIAPKKEKNFSDILKNFFAITGISAGVAGVMHFFNRSGQFVSQETANFAAYSADAVGGAARSMPKAVMMDTAEVAMDEMAEEATAEAVFAAAPQVQDGAMMAQESWNTAVSSEPSIALWFFIGAVTAGLTYLLVALIRRRFKK